MVCLSSRGSGSRGSRCLFSLGGLSGSSWGLLSGLLLLGRIGSGGLRLVAIRGCPESEVVTEELHDEGAVPVRFLGQRVELSNGVVESLLGKMAGTVG
jgi:hypothetical protein